MKGKRIWLAAIGLVVLAGFVAGAGWGRGAQELMTAADGEASIGAAARKCYTFTDRVVHRCRVQNHADSGADLYVLFNADGTASATQASITNWDAHLEPGDSVVVKEGVVTKYVDVYSTAAVTYGTDFVVKGWE